jgi:5-methylcytosine-specific restriction protein A
MKVKICATAGCNVLIPQSETYCKAHIPEPRKPFETAVRYNTKLYNTTRWRSLRKQILKEQPVCQKCGIDKNLEVHHITPPRGNEILFFNEGNLITVCTKCHKLITAREINNRK